MGLGKTLETLSLIHTNRPPSDIPTSTPPYNPLFPTTTTTATLPSTRATLIICPVSLLSQWRDEITNRFRPGTLTCAVYYGNERNLTVSDVLSPQAPDVIITTYGVVMTEWERCSRGGVNKKGLLFGVEWFRIVLDEAHWIKNRATATARSCFGLAGRRRWVVTVSIRILVSGCSTVLDSLFLCFRVRRYKISWTICSPSSISSALIPGPISPSGDNSSPFRSQTKIQKPSPSCNPY